MVKSSDWLGISSRNDLPLIIDFLALFPHLSISLYEICAILTERDRDNRKLKMI